jgi:hypothetical protein
VNALGQLGRGRFYFWSDRINCYEVIPAVFALDEKRFAQFHV